MIWLNSLIFLLLIAGHTEVQVMLINRLHSQRLTRNLLRHLEQMHQLFILVFPPWLVWFAGFEGPALLNGGKWQDVSMPWRVGFAICGLGFVSQVACAVRWQTRRTPEAVTHKPSKVFDVAERLGEKPAGRGHKRIMACLPGNQAFQVELSHREFHLPALPPSWDGLTILQLTDTHFHGTPERPFYEEVIREIGGISADLIVFTGDLLDDMDCLAWLPTTLGRLKASIGKYYILGNHDWLLDPPEIRKKMAEAGWQDVASQTIAIEHEDRKLVIGGSERPWMGQHPDFGAVSDAAFRLLLSHTPDNFYWAQKQQVDLMLSGHNHGGQVVLPVIGPMYTPSLYGVRFSSGCWDENGTLLHVSRGLAGGHPVRYNCRPEVSLITLRCVPVQPKESLEADVATSVQS